MTLLRLTRLTDGEEEEPRLGLQSLAQPDHVDSRDRSHQDSLVAGAQASPATRRRFHSVSKGQQYLQFFGSDALKRLHGCAIAEADRGADSPCAGLAEPLPRPQIGLGNTQAPLLCSTPTPLAAPRATKA